MGTLIEYSFFCYFYCQQNVDNIQYVVYNEIMNKENIIIQNINDFLRINKQSQSDLARFLNMPRQTISRMLNGQRDINGEELSEIAKFLNVDIVNLFKVDDIKLQEKQVLHHGSPNKKVTPTFGLGESKHDYGKGFYLSLDPELAKEWAVCSSTNNGYLHKYELNTKGLKILYFNQKYGVLNWLAILALHRNADNTKRYKVNAEKLIKKYLPKNIDKYDVIVGYRADDSYFSYAKNAIKNNIDISLLEKIMKTGNLGYQVFLQNKKAFDQIKEIDNTKGYYETVDFDEYFTKYEERDHSARESVADLMDSDENTLEDTIEKYLD